MSLLGAYNNRVSILHPRKHLRIPSSHISIVLIFMVRIMQTPQFRQPIISPLIILMFSFFIHVVLYSDTIRGSETQTIYTGETSNTSLILPLGNVDNDFTYKLVVSIIDQLAAAAQVIFSVQVLF